MENEISLGQLFTVFKKCLIKAVIYILVSCLVVGAAFLTVRGFTKEETYRTTITFSNADETLLNHLNSSKTNAVQDALRNMYPSQEEKVLSMSQSIIGVTAINAVIPQSVLDSKDETVKQQYIPTAFTVTIAKPDKLNISSTELSTISDYIANSLIQNYSNTNTAGKISTILTDLKIADNYEYIQIADMLESKSDAIYKNMQASLSANKVAANYRSATTGRTIAEIAADFSYIDSMISELQTLITLNGLHNEKADVTLRNFLENQLVLQQASLAKYQAIFDTAKASLETYAEKIGASSSGQVDGSVIVFTDHYYDLAEDVSKAQANLAEVQRQITITEDRLKRVPAAGTSSDPTLIAAVEKRIQTIQDSMKTVVEEYNKTIDDYNTNMYGYTVAKITMPSHKITSNSISLSTILIALVAVAVVALLIAYVQQYSKMKKQGFFDAPKAAIPEKNLTEQAE